MAIVGSIELNLSMTYFHVALQCQCTPNLHHQDNLVGLQLAGLSMMKRVSQMVRLLHVRFVGLVSLVGLSSSFSYSGLCSQTLAEQ